MKLDTFVLTPIIVSCILILQQVTTTMSRPRRDPRYLTTVQAASVLGVPKSTLLYLIKTGRCPAPLRTTAKNDHFRFDWTQADIEAARSSFSGEQA